MDTLPLRFRYQRYLTLVIFLVKIFSNLNSEQKSNFKVECTLKLNRMAAKLLKEYHYVKVIILFCV